MDADLKLYLYAPLDIRAERIANRESEDIDLAKHNIEIREKSEALRYKDIHNIDIHNMDIYDLVINSGTFNPESIIDIIKGDIKWHLLKWEEFVLKLLEEKQVRNVQLLKLLMKILLRLLVIL